MKILTTLLFTSMTLSAFGVEGFNADHFKSYMFNQTQEIKVFNYGLSALEERLQMIERAEKTIDVEYFIYRSDTSGKMFTQALIKKAQEGVKIRLLLDYVMIKNEISPFHAEELEQNGIEVKYFNPTPLLNLVKGMYRNHRKVLIIDGKVAMTGGRNIGDEYFDLSNKFNFLDRDIEVSGSIASSIQKTFDAVWNSAAAKKIAAPKMPELPQVKLGVDSEKMSYQQALEAWNKSKGDAHNFLAGEFFDSHLVDSIRSKGKALLEQEYRGECQNMGFYSEYPLIDRKNRTDRIIKLDLYDRIKNAQESIYFESPYFIDNKESEAALSLALQNKVEVTLLTNSLYSTDAVYVFDVFDSIINKWLKRGLKSYVFNGERPENYEVINQDVQKARFGIHAKTFIFDNQDVVIGTFNFDPRSANYNAEMVISCDGNPELALNIKKNIESRMKGSLYLDSKEVIDSSRFNRVGILKKIEYFFLKIPSNVFDYLL